MSDKVKEYIEEQDKRWEIDIQERKIQLLASIDKRLEELSSNLMLVKIQDARINDLSAHVAGLNRIITFLKNTGKFPSEEL